MSFQPHRNSPNASTSPAEDLPTEPINFNGRYSYDPTQSQSTLTDDDALPTLMYGSPDALPGYASLSSLPTPVTAFAGGSSTVAQQGIQQSPSNNTQEYPLLSSRPELGIRSISSPLASTTRRRGGSITARVSSGFKQLAPQHDHYPHTPSHEWTLFGQMMEDEGQLPSSPQRLSQNASTSRSTPLGRTARAGPSYIRGGALLDTRNLVEEVTVQGAFEGTGRPSSSGMHVQEEFAANDYDSRYDRDSPVSESAPEPGAGGTEDVNTGGGRNRDLFSLENFPTFTVVQRNVFKCAIAYFVASLFTFSPRLSAFIGDLTSYGPGSGGPSPSAHMVATIAVYFNPAKTVGAMIEADLFCLMGLVYSVFVCGASMSMFWWLELKPGWEWLGDAVAILWIGLSMSVVAWMKVWMASPSFNTACSMTAIIIFVVIVKEGDLGTLIGVSTIVLCGSLVSNVVCYLIWPQTATYNLQINMTKTLDSFSTLLSMLTKGFLLESENFIEKTGWEKAQKAVEDHQSSFTSLKKTLAEARKEWMDTGEAAKSGVLGMASLGQNRRKTAYEDAVASLTRLAQHLNGLRSGTRLQYELTRAGIHKGLKGKEIKINEQGVPDDEGIMLKAAAEMFGALVDEVGSPLRALTRACTLTLSQLREAFLKSRTRKKRGKNPSDGPDFAGLVDRIERVLVRFESTSNHALLRLYKRSDIPHSISASLAGLDQHTSHASVTEEKNSLLTSNDHEHVFLVYFFIFTVQEFARELAALVDAMERIYECEQRRLHRQWWIVRVFNSLFDRSGTRWWSWKRGSSEKHPRVSGLKRRFSTYLIPEHRIAHPGFPKIRPHAPNTVQTPSRKDLPFSGRVKQTLWAIGARMQETDIKYALKAGMATAILAAPAFFDATRPFFVQYWGDWALISFFVVISPTIGATNYLSLQRVLGTLFGAAVAAGIYSAFPGNAVVLSVFGFFFSLPCFYAAVSRPQYLSASRFVLLTYNLTCLYCYNVRQQDVSPLDVAFHRAVAVTAGVLWAALISRFWWPSEARRELSKALGEFCLNIGWLYMRLVASNSYSPESRSQREANGDHEVALLLGHEEDMKMKDSIHEFMAMELHLQIKLIELQGLLAQTQHEPRLKGPFPVQLYRRILTGLQTILDKLHSMRCVTTKEEWHTSVRHDFIIPVNKERREMVGNIILGFTTLASAFRLKAPLPPYLPPAEKARQRLVAAIRNLDVVKNREVKGSRQLLFFAYAMTMQGVTQELDTLGKICQEAFGVIGQTPEEFEALFPTSERISHVA